MEKKYELTDDTICDEHYGVLHRIRALRDFGGAKKGDLGGFVKNEYNLSHHGNCWICGDAKVFGNAKVKHNALVADKAEISKNAIVTDDSIVCENAMVMGNAIVMGRSRVFDRSCICGNARVYDKAKVYGYATIRGNSKIRNSAVIYGDAVVDGSSIVSCDARVYDRAYINNSKIYECARVYEDAKVVSSIICCSARICGKGLIEASYVYGHAMVKLGNIRQCTIGSNAYLEFACALGCTILRDANITKSEQVKSINNVIPGQSLTAYKNKLGKVLFAYGEFTGNEKGLMLHEKSWSGHQHVMEILDGAKFLKLMI